MKKLKDVLHETLLSGKERDTRSGMVISRFDEKIVFDMREGAPIPTTKKFAFKSMTGELLWFMSGLTDLTSLRRLSGLKPGSWTIWTNDTDRWHGEGNAHVDHQWLQSDQCGELYGHQWRNYGGSYTSGKGGVDQLANLIDGMKNNPTSRYIRVESYNPTTVARKDACLAACHTCFRVYVDGDHFDLKWSQRSVDSFLGLPFNIASYGLLMEILSKLTGLTPRFLIGDLDDVHIYKNHLDAVELMLSRDPKEAPRFILPEFSTLEELSEFTAEDFGLTEYETHGPIKAELSVG